MVTYFLFDWLLTAWLIRKGNNKLTSSLTDIDRLNDIVHVYLTDWVPTEWLDQMIDWLREWPSDGLDYWWNGNPILPTSLTLTPLLLLLLLHQGYDCYRRQGVTLLVVMTQEWWWLAVTLVVVVVVMVMTWWRFWNEFTVAGMTWL